MILVRSRLSSAIERQTNSFIYNSCGKELVRMLNTKVEIGSLLLMKEDSLIFAFLGGRKSDDIRLPNEILVPSL